MLAVPLLGCAAIDSRFGGSPAVAQSGAEPAPLPPEIAADLPTADGRPSATSAQGGYDDVGYASWYGNELAGRPTASGEPFNPQAISAAHPSLPIPSYAEVTNLDTGRTILVRINDRGPAAKNRLIDLSQAAAQQLGVGGAGVFPVRVRRTNPPEFERTALRLGQTAGERIPTPPALLAALRKKLAGAPPVAPDAGTVPAKPAKVAKAPVAAKPAKPRPGANFDPAPSSAASDTDRFVTETGNRGGGARAAAPVATAASPQSAYFIQIAAFASEARATALAKRAGARVEPAGSIYRVRLGPYASEADARDALGVVAAKGYRDAKVTR